VIEVAVSSHVKRKASQAWAHLVTVAIRRFHGRRSQRSRIKPITLIEEIMPSHLAALFTQKQTV